MKEGKGKDIDGKEAACGDSASGVAGVEDTALKGKAAESHKELQHLTKRELADKVAELEAALAEEKKLSAQYLEDAQRLKAELENYRKRMIKEQTRVIEQANSGLMAKLLPVIDNLEKAMQTAGDDDSPLVQGVRMVYGQLMEVLEREGLEVIDPHGHPFDPEVCEAVMAMVSDDHEDETVIEVHQKGYKYKGNLLRPARATVSKCS